MKVGIHAAFVTGDGISSSSLHSSSILTFTFAFTGVLRLVLANPPPPSLSFPTVPNRYPQRCFPPFCTCPTNQFMLSEQS